MDQQTLIIVVIAVVVVFLLLNRKNEEAEFFRSISEVNAAEAEHFRSISEINAASAEYFHNLSNESAADAAEADMERLFWKENFQKAASHKKTIEQRVVEFESSIGIDAPGVSRTNYKPLTQQQIDDLEKNFSINDPEAYRALINKRKAAETAAKEAEDARIEKCKTLTKGSAEWRKNRCGFRENFQTKKTAKERGQDFDREIMTLEAGRNRRMSIKEAETLDRKIQQTEREFSQKDALAFMEYQNIRRNRAMRR